MLAPTYLDHNATTPLAAGVLDAMLPFLGARCGNASSRHDYGRLARNAIDLARQQVAAAVGAHATEVVFTSGGSEANNLFIKGAAATLHRPGSARPARIAISAIEHPCVRETAHALKAQGWQVDEIAVDTQGCIDLAAYARALMQKPQLVSIMLANNETGVIQDVAVLASQARAAGTNWLHSDAVQACGKMALDFRTLNAAGLHALTLSSHKIGGPQGAAALVLDKRVELQPLIHGGGQERGLRSGTENVAAIVGFGQAASQLAARLQTMQQLAALRLELDAGLRAMGAVIFSAEAPRLPNTVYFAFHELDGETLVGKLDRAGFAVASGSACSSAQPEPSHVLRAMQVAPELARGAVRVSLGPDNTAAQVREFLVVLNETMSGLRHLRAMAS